MLERAWATTASPGAGELGPSGRPHRCVRLVAARQSDGACFRSGSGS